MLREQVNKLALQAAKTIAASEIKIPKAAVKRFRKAFKESFHYQIEDEIVKLAEKEAASMAKELVKKELASVTEADISFTQELDIYDPAQCDSCLKKLAMEHVIWRNKCKKL